GVGQGTFQSPAPKDDHEPMALAGPDDDLGAADFLDFLGEQPAELLTGRGVDSAGAAVGDDAFGIECAEIGARGDIAGVQFQAEPERLDDAATDLKNEGIVAEQAQVSGPAARGDAGRDG